MKKGFTLLELIIVIIIIGVLATLGLTQYGRMVERARGAEAREIIGSIRTNEAAFRMQHNTCTNADSLVGIGTGLDYPGPALANCAATHYFYYDVTANNADGFTVRATRCTATSKNPVGPANAWLQLDVNFTNGYDTWGTTGHY